jgi:hypothetical protein
MGKQAQKAKSQKKPYVKSEVKQVQLRPEEAVLSVCKLPNQYGPATMGCQSLGKVCWATHS